MNSRHLVVYNFLFFRDRRKICLIQIMHENTTPHKQVKTSRRHPKSYITLCNIIEKWKNRPATVCATGNLFRNYTYLLTIMTNNVLADLHPRVKFVVDTSAIVCSIRPSLTFTIFLWITT